MHSALCLVLSFFTAAAIWLLVEAEFLAIVLVLVYVGAVMVLFLFVVMMLDIDIEKLRSGFTRHFWLGIATAGVLALEIVGVVVAARPGLEHRHEGGHGARAARPPAMPPSWARRCTRSTSIPSSWRPCCCWWRSSRPSC